MPKQRLISEIPTSEEIAALRAEMAETRAEIQAKRQRKDRHLKGAAGMITARVGVPHERAFRQEASRRGCSIAELMRVCIDVALPGLSIPAPPKRLHAAHKPDRFTDPKNSHVERNAAEARNQAAQQAVRLGLEAKRLMTDVAQAATAQPRVIPGMVSDAGLAAAPRKLSR